ncbi:MAG: ATP-sensitive inward rectifier potassium channel 10 [Alphaproteobacteria bacterium]|nr:ATP-sensitive inward rectifier potassium channel 10 [Alphaproteobacteria bacterium]
MRPHFIHLGLGQQAVTDTYHYLLGMRWGTFVLMILAGYVLFNALFASIYRLDGNCYNAPDPDSWLLAFSFSVQTMASLGYGAMHPTTPWAHLVSVIEAFLGLLVSAMVTGLMFAKFARPNARVGFSSTALVMPMDGVPVLHFRMSNQRRNQVVDAKVDVTLLLEEVTAEGYAHRRLVSLELVRNVSPAFSLTWTVMHRITEDSPLYCQGKARLPDNLVSIVVNFVGVDNMFAQSVHAQTFYYPENILFDHRFRDMIEIGEGETLTVHHERLHEIEPM